MLTWTLKRTYQKYHPTYLVIILLVLVSSILPVLVLHSDNCYFSGNSSLNCYNEKVSTAKTRVRLRVE